MERNNLQLVIIAFIVILCSSCGIANKYGESNNNGDNCYKPMIKVNGLIYGYINWEEGDKKDIDGLDMLGEIEYSYMSGNIRITEKDIDFSSNVEPVGSKVYYIDEKTLLLVNENGNSFYEKINKLE